MINAFKLIKVSVKQTQFNPDATDTIIYLFNPSDSAIDVTIKNASFITVDEDNGNTAGPSDDIVRIQLKPKSIEKITEIAGWEWDGFVGLEITDLKTGKEFRFNLKNGGKPFHQENIEGTEIKPL